MSSKRAVWLGDKETIVTATSSGGEVPVGIHVMHRRHKNPKTGEIRHHGWIHFSRSGGGTIESVRNLRKLAHAIQKPIGDM